MLGVSYNDAAPDTHVLILTTFGRPGYLRRAMEHGASGFMLKDAPASDLARAIRRAASGERIVDPGLAAAALSEGDSPLTARELEVLVAAREGGSQPPVLDHRQARRAQPDGGRARRRGEGLAVSRRVSRRSRRR